MPELWHILFPLGLFGFLKEFRPSESFITQYLMEDTAKNFSKAQISQEIYPVGTYSNLSLLILVFLWTDWARYKPVIILEGLSGAATYCLIIWGHDVPTMQVAEFFYGLFMATEVAYLTYVYAMCRKEDFQKVSGFVRSGILFGRFVSGVVSQLTVSLHFLTYHQLNYLTLAGVSLSIIAAVFLPPAKKSMYFHQENALVADNMACEGSNVALSDQSTELNHSTNDFVEIYLDRENSLRQSRVGNNNVHSKLSRKSEVSTAFQAMMYDFLSSYKNPHALKWSLWWALATCGYLQVTSYIQILWEVAAGKDQLLYNGLIDAVYTLIGSISTWYVGLHKMNLSKFSTSILTVCCTLQGIFLLISVGLMNLWVQYVMYILFKVLYHSTMVLASSEIASSLQAKSHALIFGFNMFIALCLQSLVTLIVTGKGGLKLDIRNQFFVYGSYFVVLGVGFTLSIFIPKAYRIMCRNSSIKRQDPPLGLS